MATTDSILHETNWDNMMRSSIQQSLQARMKQDDKKHDSMLHVSNWKHTAAFKALNHSCMTCGVEVNIKDGYKWFRESGAYECLGCFENNEKLDWDNMDFGDIDESRCGICGCKSDNGLWDEDGDMLEDVICDDCDKHWRYDENRDAYVPRKPMFTGDYIFISSLVDEMISKATMLETMC